MQQPVYEEPVVPVQQPVHEAPAAPVQEPVYEAPAAPVQQPVYEAPPAPKAKAAGGKKGLLIGGIAGAAVLIIALLVMLISNGGDKNDPNLGLYEGAFCEAFGVTIDAEEDWLELKAGGKGTLCIMEDEIPVEWELDDEDLTLIVDDEEYEATLEDGVVILDIEGMVYTFAKEGAQVPAQPATKPTSEPTVAPTEPAEATTQPGTVPATEPATEPTAAPTEPPAVSAYDWWEGSWYGWWIIWDAEGAFADMEDDFWDAYAIIQVNDDDTGFITAWDSSMADDEVLMQATVSFTSGVGEHGTMVAEEGEFLDHTFGHADWTVDAEANLVSEFDNMIAIDGYYVDPANEANVINYIIILRPWGMDWEDVRTGDTSQSLYSDMMPLYYDNWYMPLVNMGVTEVPNSYEAGMVILESGETPTTPTTPATSSSGVLASASWEECDIKIVGAEHFIDYEGKDAIRVYYEFTNTSDECQSAYSVIEWELTQDGYELLHTYSPYDNEVPEESNDGRRVQPGVTIRCSVEMTMKADGGPITATIYDFWNEGDRLTVELDPANLPGAPKEPLEIPALMDPTMFANCASEGVYENDYYVVIDNAETTLDYEGNALIRVYFQFTNNSDTATNFGMQSMLTLYQDGCELDYGYPDSANTEDESYYMDIAPGETIRVAVCHVLRNESSPVEVVLDSWYSEDPLAKIFVFE